MTRVFIVHGWDSHPQKEWLPWVKDQLEKKGYEVYLPQMPDPLYPKIETWIPYLTKIVGTPRETDIFIGHSIGCQTILRYLETLNETQKVNKVILVAPWFVNLSEKAYEDEEDKEIAKPWLKTRINWDKIKKSATQFIALFSDNDYLVPLEENRKMLEENLDIRTIIEHNKGHFTTEDEVLELPVLLELLQI